MVDLTLGWFYSWASDWGQTSFLWVDKSPSFLLNLWGGEPSSSNPPPHQEIVKDLIVTHIVWDPFVCHQCLGTYSQEVDIVRINFHATINMFSVHHIPFGICRISYEHHPRMCGLGYAHSRLNLMDISDTKAAFCHAINHMGSQIHS